jgi:hypothetical protein
MKVLCKVYTFTALKAAEPFNSSLFKTVFLCSPQKVQNLVP